MTPSQRIAAAIALCFAAAPAWADINVGISVSATGPAASLGIPEKNTAALLPTTVAGQKINYIVLDDATNPTEANKNARKFVTENSADIIFGSSAVPTALAIAEVATETKTPQIALAPVELPEARQGLGVRGAPAQCGHGVGAGAAHEGGRRQDTGFHRLCRRLRRGLGA